MMKWKAIPGFEGYEVSNLGEVRSWKRQNQYADAPKSAKPMRQSFDSDGYLKVTLTDCGKEHTRAVHRLVALAFIGPKPIGLEVCHNDGNKTNNCVSNLRYGTRRENAQDMIAHGTSPRGKKNASCKLSEEDVRAIRRDTRKYDDIARDFGLYGRGVVSNIKSGRSWGWLD